MGRKNFTSPVSPRSAADMTRLYSRSARSRGDMLLISGAVIVLAGSAATALVSADFWEGRRTRSTDATAATAVPAVARGAFGGLRGRGRPAETAATVAPATIQGRPRFRPPPDRERPQLGQKFPLASDPQEGHFMGGEDKPILAVMATDPGGTS